MVERHIVLPVKFKDGDSKEWIQKFQICANANSWDETTQAKKLPTLLEGEALMTYLEMPEDDKKDVKKIFEALKAEFFPTESSFRSLRDFESRKLMPNESPHAFLYNLKKLLDEALPGLTGDAKEKFLLHHFLEGLPSHIAQQLRALPEVKTAQDALTRTWLLLSSEHHSTPQMTAVQETETMSSNTDQKLVRLEQLITQLDEKLSNVQLGNVQSAAVQSAGTRQQQPLHMQPQIPQCYICHQPGHVARNCRSRRTIQCYRCGQYGHVQRQCQGNAKGLAARGGYVNP